jgi:lipid II:glycine glycyltransferase (peptidoglycan interpeptide bridge formation enzyme)
VYHTLEWLRVFESLSYDIEFVDTGETIIPFVCKGMGVFRRGFSLPYDTYGGAIAGAGLVSYDEVLETLRVPSARIVDYAAKTNGTRCAVEMATTHIVPLDGDYDRVAEAYAVMNRRAIRQAAKRGVTVRVIEDPSEIPVFHAFYLDSAQRYGSPPLPLRFFQAIYDIMVPKGLARFYLAWHEDKAVGGNLILRYRDKAYDWTWGYNRELQHLRPTNAMIDRAIRDEIELGSTEFNLGASPVDANGNAQFKENFGALPFSYNIISKTNFYYDAARRIRYGRGWLTNRNGHGGSSE